MFAVVSEQRSREGASNLVDFCEKHGALLKDANRSVIDAVNRALKEKGGAGAQAMSSQCEKVLLFLLVLLSTFLSHLSLLPQAIEITRSAFAEDAKQPQGQTTRARAVALVFQSSLNTLRLQLLATSQQLVEAVTVPCFGLQRPF